MTYPLTESAEDFATAYLNYRLVGEDIEEVKSALVNLLTIVKEEALEECLTTVKASALFLPPDSYTRRFVETVCEEIGRSGQSGSRG